MDPVATNCTWEYRLRLPLNYSWSWDETGVELYYKATITDWFELTADVQALEPAVRRNATTAFVAGLRANIEF